MPQVLIRSHDACAELVKNSPEQYHVILITNPYKPFYSPKLHDIVAQAKSSLVLEFFDYEFETESRPIVSEDQIKKALSWSEGKDPIVCSCHAGVSRSSAMAYVLRCTYLNPDEALSILSYGSHYPNARVIEFGSKLLNKPEMVSLIREWKKIG